MHISKVNFGYKPFGPDFGNIGASANCHRNVNCPEGNGWDNEKNSVAMIVANGLAQCTGALIMNTCNTNIPYLLTANHCLSAGNVPNWVFQFQTWSTTCDGNVGWREDIQFNGCQLRANSAASDFALLQMNIIPPANSGINYSGWSRQTNGITSTTVLHHPAGDLMKIARDINAPITITASGADCWQLDLDLGRVEGGSSGGPYFNQNHQIIGQHYRRPQAGTMPICNITVTQGGRFDRSWTGGGTNATRLSNWLDPSGGGALTTNTTNVANLTNAYPTLSISGNSTLCTSSSTYTLNGASAGTISWTSSNTSIATVTQGNPATVTPVGNGAVNITATVTFCPGVTTAVTKTISVGVPNNYYIQNMSYSSNRLDIYPSFTGYQLSVSSWTVYVDGSFSTSGSGYPPSVISVYASCGSHNVTLTTSNSCGSYSTSSYYSGSGCYALTPNPASSNVTITDMAASSKSASKGGKVTITVFDNTNRPLKQYTFSQSIRYNFSVVNLTPGTYTVQIKQNGSATSLKLIKQ